MGYHLPKYRKSDDALVGIPIFSEKVHLDECCFAMALFGLKEIYENTRESKKIICLLREGIWKIQLSIKQLDCGDAIFYQIGKKYVPALHFVVTIKFLSSRAFFIKAFLFGT